MLKYVNADKMRPQSARARHKRQIKKHQHENRADTAYFRSGCPAGSNLSNREQEKETTCSTSPRARCNSLPF